MNNKKILFFTSFPPPNTGQSIETKLIYDYLKNYHEINIINTIDQNRLSRPSGRFSFQFTLTLITKLFALLKKILTNKYDIVYLVYGPSKSALMRDYLSILIVKMFSRAQVIGHLHSGNYGDNFKGAMCKPMLRYIIKHTRKLIILSPSINNISEYMNPGQIVYIPNMISKELQFNDDEISAKLLHSAEKELIDIYYISNMIPEKGFMDLVKAAEILVSKGINTFKVHLIGGWPSESNKQQLIDHLQKSDVNSHVEIYGAVNDRSRIKEFFFNADIFVLPTYYKIEAQPLSIIEAFNSATPVISTKHAAIPDMIIDGTNGFLVNKMSPDEIADAILKLTIRADSLLIAKQARAGYMETFSPEVILPRLLSVFS